MVRFDFNDPATFKEADNAEGVFLMEPPALDPTSYDLAVPFLHYLISTNGPPLVYLSSHGMETLLSIPFHARMEERIKQSVLRWHIVRPSFFMQGFGVYERENIEQRKIIFLPAGSGKNAFVSTVDVGDAVACLLMQPRPAQISVLTGAQAYTHYDVADKLSKVRGEKITYLDPDEVTYRKVLTEANVPEVVADYIIPLYQVIKEGKVEKPTDDLKQIIRREPESLDTVLERDFS